MLLTLCLDSGCHVLRARTHTCTFCVWHVLYIAGSLGRALEFPIHVSLYSTDDTCRGEFRYA
jgi:hypothetical protein